MLPESEIGVGLQLRRQPLPQRLAFHRWSARDLVDVDVPCVASPLEPALEGRAGDSEEVLDLLSWDATVDGGEHFQSEVLRICVHGHHFHAGPLLTQAAVRARVNLFTTLSNAKVETAKIGRRLLPVESSSEVGRW